MKMRSFLGEKGIFTIIIFFFLPFILGWQSIDMRAYLESRRQLIFQVRQERNKTQEVLSAFPGLTPYKILEKATSAFNKLQSVHIEMEAWLEDTLLHIKSSFNSDIQDLDNYRTNGRIGVSFLMPRSISTSSWVQAYQIRGIPFTWDLTKREWVEEELKISSKDTKKVLEYSVLRSLFTINEGSVDPSTVNFLGIEKRRGKDCFVLQYNLDPKMFEHWKTVGDISVKVWIDTQGYLPLVLRSEGKIGDMYILQIVNYSNFYLPLELSPPSLISERVKKEKDSLKSKVNSLSSEVSRIRGWDALQNINVEFIDRISLGEFIRGQIEKDYSKERLDNEGFVLKWLGLLYKDADYKESLINLEVSSIAGLYDPQKKIIFMGDWIHPSLAEVVLVHEIGHAFQDKYLDIEKFQKSKEREDNLDLVLAHQSLLEGESTSIMLEYLLKKDKKSFKDLGDIFKFIEEKLFKDSRYVRENILYNLYGYGANFVQAYLKRYDWSALNSVYKTPPSSMKEIIHPYKYMDKEVANTANKIQDYEIKLPGSWKKVYGTNLGEFLILLSLRQFLDRGLADTSSSGWKNDRITVYENNKDQRLIVFLTEWDSPGDASEFLQAYKEMIKKRYPGTSLKEEGRFVFLKTKDKEMFSCKSENARVKILWVKGLNLKEFRSLINKIYSDLKIHT